MAFADALIADSDADVVIVDRRHRPGGRWNDAYPFVTTTVRARRGVVDAGCLEASVPATRTPSFAAEPGVRLIPVNDLVRPTEPATGYTVIGGGKTAMDACSWLLDCGVPPEAIRRIRPRDAWLRLSSPRCTGAPP